MNKYVKKYNIIIDNMDLNNYRLRPIALIMYLQDAIARYQASKKMAPYDIIDRNLYWVVAEINMEFTDLLPFWSEEIKVELWFSEVSKTKIYIDFKIYYNDTIISKGNSLWFLISRKTHRTVDAHEIAEKFEICNELMLGEHKKFELPQATKIYTKVEHKISLSDIDFNKHVNNKSYINLAEMTAPDNFKKARILKNFHVRFNKETFLGDVLTCTTNRTKVPNTYTHIIEKDGISVCDVLTTWIKKEDKETIAEYNLEIKKEK